MRSEEEIKNRIKSLETMAEKYYNVGVPLSQNTANRLLAEVDILHWVLDDAK